MHGSELYDINPSNHFDLGEGYQVSDTTSTPLPWPIGGSMVEYVVLNEAYLSIKIKRTQIEGCSQATSVTIPGESFVIYFIFYILQTNQKARQYECVGFIYIP
jgi:hypothetical protein